ncbi:hypothetical protein HPB50_018763 [Hyalomma asiaticum]|uniref:Uncharacterized protein n=1 Tax=Hyalomma asiaticum TaxID=266040 RepID=A0ACB7S0K3_HYAAI|nr:hypothetical protein HPB50_018763 [Hyalomma asiaticum]
MRFRVHNVAIISDIEEAFLQIELAENDRDASTFCCMRVRRGKAKHNLRLKNTERQEFHLAPRAARSSLQLPCATDFHASSLLESTGAYCIPEYAIRSPALLRHTPYCVSAAESSEEDKQSSQ